MHRGLASIVPAGDSIRRMATLLCLQCVGGILANAWPEIVSTESFQQCHGRGIAFAEPAESLYCSLATIASGPVRFQIPDDLRQRTLITQQGKSLEGSHPNYIAMGVLLQTLNFAGRPHLSSR